MNDVVIRVRDEPAFTGDVDMTAELGRLTVPDPVFTASGCAAAGQELSAFNDLTAIGGVVTKSIQLSPRSGRPTPAGGTGGFSGPAIRPVAVRCVWQVHEAMPDVPLMGIGGIRTGLDALEFLLAGASAVQVGTVIFNDPSAPTRISRELRSALAECGIDRLRDIVGLAHRPPQIVVPEDPDPPGDELVEHVLPRHVSFEEA